MNVAGTLPLASRLEDLTLRVEIAQGRLKARRGEIKDADVVLVTHPQAVAAAVYGKAPLDALDAQGDWVVRGDVRVFERFVDFFHLPEKAVLEALP